MQPPITTTKTVRPDHEQAMTRARLALQGLSLGDGFGQRFFGPAPSITAMIAQRALPKGPWQLTDDSVMGICVTEVLQQHRGIDPEALALAFVRRYAQDPRRGYGRGAHGILGQIMSGVSYRLAAGAAFNGEGSMGNGAAMRAAPIGAYFAHDLSATIEHALLSAEPTHTHPDGKAGGVAVAVAAALVFRQEPRLSGAALLDAVIEHTPDGPTRQGMRKARALGLDSDVAHAAAELGTGGLEISSDTVPFSLWCVARNIDDYEAALWDTVAGLGDRDTTCAIVGGIVAGRVGEAGLPTEWLSLREALPDPLHAPIPQRSKP